jgi:putative transcriptional regulator
MSKKAFDKIMAGIEDGIAFAKGDKRPGVEHIVRVPAAIDVRAIRRKFGLSQQKFADRFGFDARALQEWEQGRRRPDRATHPVPCHRTRAGSGRARTRRGMTVGGRRFAYPPDALPFNSTPVRVSSARTRSLRLASAGACA